MSDTLKIGLSLKDDFNSLRKRQDMHPDRGNWIELQEYVGSSVLRTGACKRYS